MKGCSLILICALLSIPSGSNGQEFHMARDTEKFSMSFQEVGNLVVVPVSINGSTPLNFIIDTGSPYTIITNIEAVNYFQLKKGKSVFISGLGQSTRRLEAYLSHGNSLTVGEAVSQATDIVLLFEEDFNLSSRFGIPIYGIIGYDLLKDFVVEINYYAKRVSFYTHDYFYRKKKNKLKKFDEIPMEVNRKKPYLIVPSGINGQEVPLKLLIDSGSWDALWLFENPKESISIPPQHINDYLGFGLNGEIHGKKSRIAYIQLGSTRLIQPTTSFPDSLSTANISRTERNGTLGGEVLNRFTTIYDYRNCKLFLRNNKRYKDEFHYNMAGIELYQPYPELPYLEVLYVRESSPAAVAGLKKGDAIRYVNGKKIGIFQPQLSRKDFSAGAAHLIELDGKKQQTISLPEMIDLFKTREGTKISIIYTRGMSMVQHFTSFTLQKSI